MLSLDLRIGNIVFFIFKFNIKKLYMSFKIILTPCCTYVTWDTMKWLNKIFKYTNVLHAFNANFDEKTR